MNRAERRKLRVVALMMLALSAAWINRTAAAQEAHVEAVLSALTEKPLVVVRGDGLTSVAGAVAETRVGRQVQDSPLLSSLLDCWKSGLHVGAALLADLPGPTVERLMSREVALVVFESSEVAEVPVAAALAVYLGEDAEMVKGAISNVTLPRLKASDPGLSVSGDLTSGDGTIGLHKGPEGVYMRLAGDLLVVGTQAGVEKFRDYGSEPEWLDEVGGPDGMGTFYLDLASLWEQAAEQTAGNPAKAQELARSGLPALRYVQGSTGVVEGGFKDTVVASVDPAVGGFLPAAMALAAGRSRCAGVVPDDYVLLVSLQIESGQELYSLVEEAVRQNEGEAGVQEFHAGMASIEQVFGINVERELLPVIGSEVFFAARLPDIDVLAAEGEPQPRDFAPIVGFATEDAEALHKLVERLAASPQASQSGWRLTTEDYEGTELHTLYIGLEGFSFAFLDGYCVCAREAPMLRPVISAVAAGDVLADEAQYLAVRRHLPRAVNALAYLDTRPLKGAVMALLPDRVPADARPYLSLIESFVPDLGGYGVAIVADDAEIRLEAYGDVPLAYSFFGALSLGGAVDSQVRAAQVTEQASPAQGP
ncbi:MAG: DUF3352 domain-containing protein [Planctomycetota bacterium]|jgi:hypothetical protein